MAYKVIILYQLYMPSYFLGTFTEYPELYKTSKNQVTLRAEFARFRRQNFIRIFHYRGRSGADIA